MTRDDQQDARAREKEARQAMWAEKKAQENTSSDPLERIARDINTIKNILIIVAVLTAISVLSLATLR